MLELATVPDPTPGPGEALLRVRATAVNRADVMQRRGHYPPPPGASDSIGLEAAGEVVALGPGATGPRVGSRVMALLSGGGYAELVAVPTGQLMPVPDGMGWEDAAAIPEVFITAYLTLRILGRLDEGEVALIHSGASGVGTAAIQIARELGARPIATSRIAERLALPVELGADGVVATDGRFAERVRELTGGRGADVVLDLVGAACWPLALDALAPRGRIVAVGTLSGARVELDLALLMRRRATLIGTVLRSRTAAEKAVLTRAFAERMLPALAAGRLRPVVDRVLPLAEAAAAHALLEQNDTLGKVVLLVGPPDGDATR